MDSSEYGWLDGSKVHGRCRNVFRLVHILATVHDPKDLKFGFHSPVVSSANFVNRPLPCRHICRLTFGVPVEMAVE